MHGPTPHIGQLQVPVHRSSLLHTVHGCLVTHTHTVKEDQIELYEAWDVGMRDSMPAVCFWFIEEIQLAYMRIIAHVHTLLEAMALYDCSLTAFRQGRLAAQ